MFVCVFAKKFPALASQSCCEVSRPRAVGEYEYRLLTTVKMGLVQTTIRKLIAWAQVRSGTRSGIFQHMPDGYVLLIRPTHTRSLLIRIFALLMKVN